MPYLQIGLCNSVWCIVDFLPSDSEEMACDEAELGPEEFTEKMLNQQKLHEQVLSSYILVWVLMKDAAKRCMLFLFLFQQLEMLKYMRKFHLEDQSAILEKVYACMW